MVSYMPGILICAVLIIQILMQLNGQTIGTREDYCGICPDHTMCLFTGISPVCGVLVSRFLNPGMRQIILDAHNEVRNKIALGLETLGKPGPQPPAADMLEIKWDYELEIIAQRWADQCNFNHDKCRRLKTLKAGQNLAITGTNAKKVNTTQDWAVRTMVAWYSNEAILFNKSFVQPFRFDASWGHYSQLLWSRTNLVGCGFSQYPDGNFTRKLYACNYAPCGNIIESYMYKTGPACSQCPNNTTCKNIKYKGLCTK